MLLRLFALACLAGSLMACSTTQVSNAAIEIPLDCQKYISSSDVAEIRSLLASRSDIRKPLWGITCDDRGRAIAESGPHRDHDVCSFVTLIRRLGKWHIISIKEGPVVMVTEWMPDRPNQALERTADRRENLLSMTSPLKPEAQLALVSGRSACSR
jgi:hypothetical protein